MACVMIFVYAAPLLRVVDWLWSKAAWTTASPSGLSVMAVIVRWSGLAGCGSPWREWAPQTAAARQTGPRHGGMERRWRRLRTRPPAPRRARTVGTWAAKALAGILATLKGVWPEFPQGGWTGTAAVGFRTTVEFRSNRPPCIMPVHRRGDRLPRMSRHPHVDDIAAACCCSFAAG